MEQVTWDMASPRPRPFWLDVLLRGARFLYLLWGGMLLGTLAFNSKLRFPDFLYQWPEVVRFLTRPWGKGLLLGLALAMALAALVEMWELVDRLLVHLLHDHDRDR
jgi:hypothetical protein